MEMNANTNSELLALAKQALLDGDKGRASQIALDVLQNDSQNVTALLIMAGVSESAISLNYINRVLAIDPNNQTAHQAMRWASQRLRETVKAEWKPETTAPAAVVAVKSTQASPSTSKKFVLTSILPWLLAFIAILGYGFWSVGLLDPDPNSVGRYQVLSMFSTLLKGKAAPIGDPTQLPTNTQKPTEAIMVPIVFEPVDTATQTPTETATEVPTPTSSSTATSTNTPTSTSTSTATSTSTRTSTPTNTPLPPTPTATLATPVQEFDPTSGLPIIQITPLVYLTEAPDPNEYVEPTEDENPIEYVSEPELPAYNEPLGEKWIDVNLSEQMLYAYEGDTIVGAFLVSTGMADTPTVTGHYYVYVKIPYTRMTGPGYDLPDVPYTMYFYKGYGIHGTYWHNNFGTPMSHGCVNMETGQAGWLYDWAFVGIPVSVHY